MNERQGFRRRRARIPTDCKRRTRRCGADADTVVVSVNTERGAVDAEAVEPTRDNKVSILTQRDCGRVDRQPGERAYARER